MFEIQYEPYKTKWPTMHSMRMHMDFISLSYLKDQKKRFPITWVGLADAKRFEGTLGYSRRMECSCSLICCGSEPSTKETEPEIHQIPASQSTSDRRTLPHIYMLPYLRNPLIRSLNARRYLIPVTFPALFS